MEHEKVPRNLGKIDALDGNRIAIGNAGDSRFSTHRGWFMGAHVDPAAGLRSTAEMEVKWCEHIAGDTRSTVSYSEFSTSLAILISGAFHFSFPGQEIEDVTLARQGDYVIYAAGVGHTWRALEDSVMLTVRWPSKAHK